MHIYIFITKSIFAMLFNKFALPYMILIFTKSRINVELKCVLFNVIILSLSSVIFSVFYVVLIMLTNISCAQKSTFAMLFYQKRLLFFMIFLLV